jgi:hypothetical protein
MILFWIAYVQCNPAITRKFRRFSTGRAGPGRAGRPYRAVSPWPLAFRRRPDLPPPGRMGKPRARSPLDAQASIPSPFRQGAPGAGTASSRSASVHKSLSENHFGSLANYERYTAHDVPPKYPSLFMSNFSRGGNGSLLFRSSQELGTIAWAYSLSSGDCPWPIVSLALCVRKARISSLRARYPSGVFVIKPSDCRAFKSLASVLSVRLAYASAILVEILVIWDFGIGDVCLDKSITNRRLLTDVSDCLWNCS